MRLSRIIGATALMSVLWMLDAPSRAEIINVPCQNAGGSAGCVHTADLPPRYYPLVLLGDSQVKQEKPISQDHVLGATGCGTSCGMQTEQLSHLEDIGMGWKRVKVKRTILVNKCDHETRLCETIPAPYMKNPIFEEWIFANCSNRKFAIGSTPYLIDSRDINPFFEEGELAGKPNYSTASLNPFMQWAKICKQEAEEGWNDIRSN